MPDLHPGSLCPTQVSITRYCRRFDSQAKVEDELTALTKGIGEIAAVSRETAVDTHVDT